MSVLQLGFMLGPTLGETLFQMAGFTWAVLPSAVFACVMALVALLGLQPWRREAKSPEKVGACTRVY